MIANNPHIDRFEVIRERCPQPFIDYFIRKVNHLRSRHQAKPVSYDAKIARDAQYILTHQALTSNNNNLKLNAPLSANITFSVYNFQASSGGIRDLFVDAEQVVQHFYLKGARQYRSYGRVPNPNESFLRMNDFVNLIWQSTDKVCLSDGRRLGRVNLGYRQVFGYRQWLVCKYFL